MSDTFKVSVGGILAEVQLIRPFYKIDEDESMEWEIVDIIDIEDDYADLPPEIRRAFTSALDATAQTDRHLSDEVSSDIKSELRREAESEEEIEPISQAWDRLTPCSRFV